LNPYYARAVTTAGEELHGMIARRYGAPLASIREALFDVFLSDESSQQVLGASISQLMANTVHPTAAGFKIYGDVVAYTVRQTLAGVLANGAVDPRPSDTIDAAVLDGGKDLPLPISPVAAQQDAGAWCREGPSFKAVASCTENSYPKSSSCEWKTLTWHESCPHRNCRIRGYFMTGRSQALRMVLDTSTLAAARNNNGSADVCSNTTCDGSELADSGVGQRSAADFQRRYLAVTYLQGSNVPARRMAAAQLVCVRGCKCKPVQLTFRSEANTGIAATQVSV
jgi:hypothetical protein